MQNQKRLLVIGAHPDDCDFFTAGTAIKLVSKGHAVKYVSVTNGNAGHYRQSGEELAQRRYAETQASAKVLSITYEVMDLDDGKLTPSLENREAILRKIREYRPDIIITNRSNDYHTDHRATAQLVLDASFLLAVPNICPDVPALDACPPILYWGDRFTEPTAFRADVALPVDDYLDTILEAFKCHVSQTFEWLPWIEGHRDFPNLPMEQREALLEDSLRNHPAPLSHTVQKRLTEVWGAETAQKVRRAEAYQVSEYGAPLSQELRNLLEQ